MCSYPDEFLMGGDDGDAIAMPLRWILGLGGSLPDTELGDAIAVSLRWILGLGGSLPDARPVSAINCRCSGS